MTIYTYTHLFIYVRTQHRRLVHLLAIYLQNVQQGQLLFGCYTKLLQQLVWVYVVPIY